MRQIYVPPTDREPEYSRRGDLCKDQFGRTWFRDKRTGGWRHEQFLIRVEEKRRQHAPKAFRRVIYEGRVELAQLDSYRETDAFRYVEELLAERDLRETEARIVWRVRYWVEKGREILERDCDMFVEAESLPRASQKALLAASDLHGGFIFLESVKRATGGGSGALLSRSEG